MYHERVVTQDGVLEVLFHSPDDFVLFLKAEDQTVVEYRPGRRILRGKATPYDFKSVEQLRYDFEQDAQSQD